MSEITFYISVGAMVYTMVAMVFYIMLWPDVKRETPAMIALVLFWPVVLVWHIFVGLPRATRAEWSDRDE